MGSSSALLTDACMELWVIIRRCGFCFQPRSLNGERGRKNMYLMGSAAHYRRRLGCHRSGGSCICWGGWLRRAHAAIDRAHHLDEEPDRDERDARQRDPHQPERHRRVGVRGEVLGEPAQMFLAGGLHGEDLWEVV